MTDYIRRLVSGNKARFKDGKLNLELDLVYVTDSVIIMGYPASGIEGLYRNRREDAQKFLRQRHGTNFWVYNFCPVRENSYPSSVFDGRVSRYPFPDHHAPPLALLPLAAREMHVWLQGSPDRVIVLHCKAGKGRSGTLACTYLLSLEDSPTPPQLERSYSTKQWAENRADELMQAMPTDDTVADLEMIGQATLTTEAKVPTPKNYDTDEAGLLKPPQPNAQHSILLQSTMHSPASASIQGQESAANSFSGPLKNVLDLHTSRRMKISSTDANVKQGVSIPSQRRWLYYWSLLLTHQGPANFWPQSPGPAVSMVKVRITQINVRMKEITGFKMNLVKVVNIAIGRTRGRKSNDNGNIWASLARYDDEFVDKLEMWERGTRDDSGHLGRRKQGSEHGKCEELGDLFVDQRWDKGKMVRSFARMGAVGVSSIQKENSEKDGHIICHTLRPLTDAKWASIRHDVQQDIPEALADTIVPSEANSITDITHTLNTEGGIVVDAGREVRVKLYMGQVFMGWLWFIPAFHIQHSLSSTHGTTRFVLTRKELDFALGVGSAIIDVEISMQICEDVEADMVHPLARQTSQELGTEEVDEPVIASTMIAVAAGGVEEIVEVKQAVED